MINYQISNINLPAIYISIKINIYKFDVHNFIPTNFQLKLLQKPNYKQKSWTLRSLFMKKQMKLQKFILNSSYPFMVGYRAFKFQNRRFFTILIQKNKTFMVEALNDGDNAWVLVSACMVMFMVPGLSFFYGGMVDKKNLLSTIAYCLLTFCVASIVWALLGFSLAFGDETGAKGFIGDCKYCGLRNMTNTMQNIYAPTVPMSTFFIFQTMFAGITPSIFVGSMIGRVKLSFLFIFTICFNILIYSPIAYWMWNKNGWLYKMDAIDFAGGNVIHIPAGFTGLAFAIFTGYGLKRNYKQNSASISLTLVGTGILWFGWFGFNGGSALASAGLASVAVTNTHLAACAAGLAWAGIHYLLKDGPSILGWCCGAVCGLVAITPAAGFVSLWSSLVIGAIGGALACLFCHFKAKYFEQLADTLDVFGCHGIAASWGSIATGAFATKDTGNNFDGLFYGNGRQFGVNVLGVVVCAAYSFFVSLLLMYLISLVISPKVSAQVQQEGLDWAIHKEQDDPLTEKQVLRMLQSQQVKRILSQKDLFSGKDINQLESKQKIND